MKSRNIREFMKEINIDDLPSFEANSYQSTRKTNFGWYRPADNDEFPVGTYMESVTGRGIKYYFKSSGSSNNRLCHNASDAEYIIDKFKFKKIYVQDYYEDEEKILYARNVYELVTDDGIFILSVSNVPVLPRELRTKKSVKKDTVYIGISGNGKEEVYEEIRDEIVSRYKKPAVQPNNVHLVINSPHGYDTEEFDLPKQKIDIELNYGSEFIPIHKKIIETLNTPKSKGLVLLHGEPGTGKTHYLKYIASKIKDKRVLFIPPFLAEFITSPQMTPFLIDNANSVLFIEDAERVITDRNENGGNGVSNILNITDGILSDILNIQIVATFNMDKKKIDAALLRKGRLIAEHRFDALSIENSNKLLKHLGSNYVTNKEMTLTEIYNYKDEHYVSEEKRAVIGFRPR